MRCIQKACLSISNKQTNVPYLPLKKTEGKVGKRIGNSKTEEGMYANWIYDNGSTALWNYLRLEALFNR